MNPGTDFAFRGDGPRHEQSLGNLIDNALRHGAGTITLSAARHEELVELRVSDEGNGFPDGFVDHAFERFIQVDAARSGTGARLDLAIVDVIAHAHRGRACIAVDGASDIWLELPADPDLAQVEPRRPDTPHP